MWSDQLPQISFLNVFNSTEKYLPILHLVSAMALSIGTAQALIITITFAVIVHQLQGHGVMNRPNQRGALRTGKFVPVGIDEDAPHDFLMHFPAGDKNVVPGSAKLSQEREAGKIGWKPFTPLDPSFHWRSGVCGDLKADRQHLRGGEFYYGAKIVANYTEGGIIDVGLAIGGHHNGYMELHICDVQKCGGEISESCFRSGHCKQLLRAHQEACEDQPNRNCGPIDRMNRGRWYLPCSKFPVKQEKTVDFYGNGTILYRLPPGLTCKHCVIQWFWTTANSCNPPGLLEYFDAPYAPKWGICEGQGGAIGGVTRVQQNCSSDRFPEEYLQCADVQIYARKSPTTTPHPSPKMTSSLAPQANASKSPTSITETPLPLVQASMAPSETPYFPESSLAPTPEETGYPTLIATEEPYFPESSVVQFPEETVFATVTSDSFSLEELEVLYTPAIGNFQNRREIEDIVLVVRNKRLRSLYGIGPMPATAFRQLGIEVVIADRFSVPNAKFFINGKLVFVDAIRPYVLWGDNGNLQRALNMSIGHRVQLMVKAGSDTDTVGLRVI